jgi:hypothetical protein
MSDLLDLIWFCLATVSWLQIQYLVDSFFGEYVVTSTDAFLKAQAPQHAAHTVKGDIRIRGATEYPKQELLMLTHHYNPLWQSTITWKIFRNNPYIGKMRKIFCNPPFRFSRYYGQIRNAAAFVPLVTQMRDGLLFA